MVDVFGRVDVVVNNAGQGLQATVEEVDIADARAVLELNVLAPLVVMQAAAPLLRATGGGSIVNVSSGTTLAAAPGTGPCAASRAALEMTSGARFDPPEKVAEAVLEVVRTGAAQVDVVPAAYGGSA